MEEDLIIKIYDITEKVYIIPEIEDYYQDLQQIKKLIEDYKNASI